MQSGTPSSLGLTHWGAKPVHAMNGSDQFLLNTFHQLLLTVLSSLLLLYIKKTLKANSEGLLRGDLYTDFMILFYYILVSMSSYNTPYCLFNNPHSLYH